MCILFHTATCGLGLEHFGLGLGLDTDGLGLGTAGLANYLVLLLLSPLLLHCALAAVQCIVIGPVCLWLGGSVTSITRNCVHRGSS